MIRKRRDRILLGLAACFVIGLQLTSRWLAYRWSSTRLLWETQFSDWHLSNEFDEGRLTLNLHHNPESLRLAHRQRRVHLAMEEDPQIVFMFLTYNGVLRRQQWEWWYEDGVKRLEAQGIAGKQAIVGTIHMMNLTNLDHVPSWLQTSIDRSAASANWEAFGRVMHNVLKYSLERYPNGTHFIQVSDSHMPLRGPDEIFHIIKRDPRSVFNTCVARILSPLKHNGWTTLTRRHAKLFLKASTLWQDATLLRSSGFSAGVDEMWPIRSLLFLAPHEAGPSEINHVEHGHSMLPRYDCTSVCVWMYISSLYGTGYNPSVTSHPWTLTSMTPIGILHLVSQKRTSTGAWFFRKIQRTTNLTRPCTDANLVSRGVFTSPFETLAYKEFATQFQLSLADPQSALSKELRGEVCEAELPESSGYWKSQLNQASRDAKESCQGGIYLTEPNIERAAALKWMSTQGSCAFDEFMRSIWAMPQQSLEDDSLVFRNVYD